MALPVLVLFWTPRSEVSIGLGELLEKLVGEYKGGVRLARIEVDTQAQVAAMFGIRSVPTEVIVRDGQPADGFAGALPESEIREFLVATQRRLPPPMKHRRSCCRQTGRNTEQAIARLQQEIAAAPERAELKLDLAVAFMQTGNATAAQAELDALPANLEGDDRAKRRAGRSNSSSCSRMRLPASELEARIATRCRRLRRP